MSDAKPEPTDTGKLRVDVFALKRLLFANGWAQEDFCRETGITKATARRLMAGGPARMSTLRSIAQDLGVEPIDLIDASEYERPQEAEEMTPKVELREWIAGRPLTEIKSTSNGLQYRIFRMQHRHQPTRFGRGKRYEFAHLADESQEKLKDRFVRHMEVCDRIGRHPQFPTCYATYPELGERVWWVIDQWVDGLTLAGRLANGSPSLPIAANWSRQLAAGLSAMHTVGIVRRELNPENILVREADESLLLTDFELAKLAGNLPTVSDQWPDDPYRAPEIGAGEPTPAADLYSWGRIVTHLVAGELPPREKESSSLVKRLPKPVFDVVIACTALRQSQRPGSFDEVLPIINDWVKSLSKEPTHGK